MMNNDVIWVLSVAAVLVLAGLAIYLAQKQRSPDRR
jgi:hypothetical protein